MSDDDVARRRVGLCASCAHGKVVRSSRGSEFWLCELSKRDAAFAKYPALPVLHCAGFEGAAPGPR